MPSLRVASFLLLGIAALSILAALTLTFASDARAVPAARWRVLVYMAADNDLHTAAAESLREIESVVGSGSARVALQIDRPAPRARTGGERSGTFRYTTAKDLFGGYRLREVASLGAGNSGSKDALRAFIEWGTRTIAAERTLVVLWGHGRGDRGLLVDESEHSHMLPRDVTQALAGLPVDVLALDLCAMQTLGVAADLAPAAHYLAGSASARHALGWPYARLLTLLDSEEPLSPRDLASWLAEHSGDRGGEYTGSAIDLTRIHPLTADTTVLLASLGALSASERAALRAALERLPPVAPAAKTIDLGAALSLVAELLPEPTRAAQASLTAAVLATHSSPAFADTTGLAVRRSTFTDALGQ